MESNKDIKCVNQEFVDILRLKMKSLSNELSTLPEDDTMEDKEEALHNDLDMTKKRRDFLKTYKYRFTETKDGRWQTINAFGKKPHKVKAKTMEELIDRLIAIRDGKGIHRITLNGLYEEYEKYRKGKEVNSNTIKRDQQRYERYFADTEFFNRDIRSLTLYDWDIFCNDVVLGKTKKGYIHEEDQMVDGVILTKVGRLTAKEWASTRCILNGMMRLAVRKGYIDPKKNYLEDIEIEANQYRSTPHVENDEKVFDLDEQELLEKWCEEKFTQTKKPAYLFPVLGIELGTRIGEAAALKFSDICVRKGALVILVNKMEYIDKMNKTINVVDRTKTYTDRAVILSGKAISIIRTLHMNAPDNEWIFTSDGKRCTARQLNYVLEKYAKEKGVEVKASHSLRRTCGSNMMLYGFTTRACSDALGNSEEIFLRHYSYDTSSQISKAKLLGAPIAESEDSRLFLKEVSVHPNKEKVLSMTEIRIRSKVKSEKRIENNTGKRYNVNI